MRILMVTAHPNSRSLTQFIAQVAIQNLEQSGHAVRHFNLYEMGFNPVLIPAYTGPDGSVIIDDDLHVHIQAIDWADGLIFVYPIWWWDRPAILKGWFERAFPWGFALEVQNRGHVGLLSDKRALVFQTCGDSLHNSEKVGSIEVMHGCIRDGTLDICGVRVDAVETFYQVSQSEDSLEQIRARVEQICQIWK